MCSCMGVGVCVYACVYVNDVSDHACVGVCVCVCVYVSCMCRGLLTCV